MVVANHRLRYTSAPTSPRTPAAPDWRTPRFRAHSLRSIHLHKTSTRTGKKEKHPLEASTGPNAGAIAGFQPETGKSTSSCFDAFVQLMVGEASVLMSNDECVVVRESLGHGEKRFGDSVLQKGSVGAARETQLSHMPCRATDCDCDCFALEQVGNLIARKSSAENANWSNPVRIPPILRSGSPR